MTHRRPHPAPARRWLLLPGLLAAAAALPAAAAPAPAPPAVKAPAPAAPAPVRRDGLEIVTLPPDGVVTRAEITTDHHRVYLERYDPEETGRLMVAACRAWSAFFGKEPPRGKDGKPVRMTVKGYATPERYQAGGKADGTPTPSGAPNMGMYWTGTSIAHFYATSGPDCMRYMILHEAMHQYHYIAATGNGGATANWYIEGLAIWSGNSAWDGKTLRLGGGVKPGTLGGHPRTLAGLTADPAAAVAFLVTQYPLEFRRLASVLNQRREEREAWKEAFGFEEAPSELADEYDAWAGTKPDAGFESWEPLVLRRAAFAAANVAAWRLGKAAPSSLARLRDGMKAALAQGEAKREEAVQLFRQSVPAVLQDLAAYPAQAAAVVKPAADGLAEAAAALKVKAAPAVAAAPPPPRPRAAVVCVNPDAPREYEGRLRTRVQALVAAGRRLSFECQMVASTVRLESLDVQGNLKVRMDGGGQMDLTWAQLSPRDRLKLALALVVNEVEALPEDQALAAYFLLQSNTPEKAEGHLRSAGKAGEADRAAFRAEEPPAEKKVGL